jgi:hypothetical protein
MRVEQLIPVKKMRKSLPKTVDAIQTRIERLGSGVADRIQTVAKSDTVAKARKAVRRGSEETVKWVRKNPKALPLAGLGLGGMIATWLMVRSRRKSRQPKFLQKALQTVGSVPGLRQGFATTAARFLSWALTPRKPHVFRAISIRW